MNLPLYNNIFVCFDRFVFVVIAFFSIPQRRSRRLMLENSFKFYPVLA